MIVELKSFLILLCVLGVALASPLELRGKAPLRPAHKELVGEVPMHTQLSRYAAQVLLAAGHTQKEVAELIQIPTRSVRRIAKEERVSDIDDSAERKRRRVGRPSKTDAYRELVAELLKHEPTLMTLEVLRRCRARGYSGGKSALYLLVADLRPSDSELQMRFEGCLANFRSTTSVTSMCASSTARRSACTSSRRGSSTRAACGDARRQRAHRDDRALAARHFVAFGGVPLCAVFDRPKTVALKWRQRRRRHRVEHHLRVRGHGDRRHGRGVLAKAQRQKGTVENLVGWVKGSFFKQRRFHDVTICCSSSTPGSTR